MGPTRVLFLCSGNSARSIIAEALLREIGGAAFEVHSAGITPKGVHPHTIRVLSDAGISTDSLRSQHVDEFASARFDYVITVCDDAAERCPVFPGEARRIHWSLEDPAAADADAQHTAFDRTHEALQGLIKAFVGSPAN